MTYANIFLNEISYLYQRVSNTRDYNTLVYLCQPLCVSLSAV